MKSLKFLKKITVIFLAVLSAVSLIGCGSEPSATEGTQKAESEQAVQAAAYESADGWKLEYSPDSFELKEENGVVRLTCKLEKTGADYFEISYVKEKLPQEVLYEKTADIDDSRVTRSEGRFASLDGDWSFDRIIEPAGGSDLSEQYTGIEHNGGTLLVYAVMKMEADEEQAELISDTMADTISTLTFTSHEPQQEFSYVPGTYERSYTEEIEGQKVECTDRIVLKADHTGTLSFQDDIPLEWSSYELILDSDPNRYEYTVEGDSLLVNLDGAWVSFERVD